LGEPPLGPRVDLHHTHAGVEAHGARYQRGERLHGRAAAPASARAQLRREQARAVRAQHHQVGAGLIGLHLFVLVAGAGDHGEKALPFAAHLQHLRARRSVPRGEYDAGGLGSLTVRDRRFHGRGICGGQTRALQDEPQNGLFIGIVAYQDSR